jgi:hypothetical protein
VEVADVSVCHHERHDTGRSLENVTEGSARLFRASLLAGLFGRAVVVQGFPFGERVAKIDDVVDGGARELAGASIGARAQDDQFLIHEAEHDTVDHRDGGARVWRGEATNVGPVWPLSEGTTAAPPVHVRRRPITETSVR